MKDGKKAKSKSKSVKKSSPKGGRKASSKTAGSKKGGRKASKASPKSSRDVSGRGKPLTFGNAVVAAAFKRAVKKYPLAFKRLTD